MAGFVQIMEIQTSKIDEIEVLAKQMDEERGTDRPTSRATVTADRDRPGYYLIIVEFDSYDEAMRNSNDPVTTKYSEMMSALLGSPPRFYNLDVQSVM